VDLAAVAAGLIFAAAGGIEWRRAGLSEARIDLDAVPLTNAPGDQYSPSFSPEGREVTFTWKVNRKTASTSTESSSILQISCG
jgi:WD40 repeat protein